MRSSRAAARPRPGAPATRRARSSTWRTRGEGRKVGAVVGAVEAQTVPGGRFELLLALDGAELDPAILPRVAALNGRCVRLERRGGPGAARNVAAAQARGDWLAFTEDDVTPAPDWLERACERIAREPAPDVIEGVTERPGGRPLRVRLE